MNFIVEYPEKQEYDGIIPYFDKLGLQVSYVYTDIFNLVGNDPKHVAYDFLSKFTDKTNFYPYYKLIDLLSKEKIRTVFCLKETSKGLIITKGAKKLVAMAVNNLYQAPVLIIGKQLYGEKLNNDTELYNLLKNLDPSIETIKCEIVNPPDPMIHILENVNHVKVWRSL